MAFDLAVKETGNGGDLVLRGADLAVIYSIENEAYLATFGGNPEQDTPAVITEEQSYDYWANDLLYKGNSSVQFNSQTERTLDLRGLNSEQRLKIEEAIKNDLKYMQELGADVKVKVVIKSDNWIQWFINITMPDGSKSVTLVEGRKLSEGDFFIQDFNDDFFV